MLKSILVLILVKTRKIYLITLSHDLFASGSLIWVNTYRICSCIGRTLDTTKVGQTKKEDNIWHNLGETLKMNI